MTEIFKNKKEPENHWVSISDMMSGLMMVFLFIAISFMVYIQKDLYVYRDLRENLYNDLKQEFENDLQKWDANISSANLSIEFREPDVLFDAGSSMLKPRFKVILDDFFPRYVKILTEDEYKNVIEEIRIEGHTSLEWEPGASIDEAYFGNMQLSQNRTREVLKTVLSIRNKIINNNKDWLKERLTANGLSSSKLKTNENGIENREKSRRVEFSVRTNAEEQISNQLKL